MMTTCHRIRQSPRYVCSLRTPKNEEPSRTYLSYLYLMYIQGNDDQAFWALAALSAAERSFPGLSSSSPKYLSLAGAVFDDQVLRWDNKTCGGGLRWQIFTFNDGYNYKISSANGAFFQLAARLAVFTGNQTYADWAETAYAWSEKIGLIKNGTVFDGADVTTECGVINHLQWTLDQGLYLYGSAVMYNLVSILYPLTVHARLSKFSITYSYAETDSLPHLAKPHLNPPKRRQSLLPRQSKHHVRSCLRAQGHMQHRPAGLQSPTVALALAHSRLCPLYPGHHQPPDPVLRTSGREAMLGRHERDYVRI
jgi:hypothetical protein